MSIKQVGNQEFTKKELFEILNREKEYWNRKFHTETYDGMQRVHGRLIEIERIKRLITKRDAYKYSCRYVSPEEERGFNV